MQVKFKLAPLILVLALLLSQNSFAQVAQNIPPFEYQISDIPPATQDLMRRYTWHPSCPVDIEELAYVQLSYWGFDNQKHEGVLIVDKQLADEVVDIFKEIYYQKFPIESMQPVCMFQGNDDASMAANNTSAFNCRRMGKGSGSLSWHSYGRAIDINPVINPYVKGLNVRPPAGRAYLNRDKPIPGMITRGDVVYQAFVSRGWRWGGSWASRRDYQHFEKRG